MADSNFKTNEQQSMLQSGWPHMFLFPFPMLQVPPSTLSVPPSSGGLQVLPPIFGMPLMIPPNSGVPQNAPTSSGMPFFPFFLPQIPTNGSEIHQMTGFPLFLPQPPPSSGMPQVQLQGLQVPQVQPLSSDVIQSASDLPLVHMQLFPMIFPPGFLGGQQIHKHPEKWHPDHAPRTGHTKDCLRIFNAHIKQLLKNPQPGADIFPDEDDATLVELLLYGSHGTPYEGGFFHFSVRAMPDYPKQPPRVAFRTASSTGRVRFNPNFYENGCVCLSILGTWGGNSWKEDFDLKNVLHLLQSCLRADPLANEPAPMAATLEERVKKSKLYSDQVAYETLRETVCGQLERRSLPSALHKRAAAHFVQHYQAYRDRCNQLKKRFDGLDICNVYNQENYQDTYEFAAVYRRMEKLLPIAQLDAKEDAEE